ncbi:MAG: HAD family hydrolase [Muribaculum sp.]|nr:HAD family hydrolase [Muribaculum sp.]MDE6457756.1 HAD family hydrolase [Muribaculum sp.]
MKKLVIFDLDGTLLNTIEDLGRATNYALEKCGHSAHPLSAYPGMVGNGVKKLIERALPSGLDTEEEVERAREYFKEFYEEHNTEHTAPYPGIMQLLGDLRARDIKVAVASNKYQAAVERLVDYYFPEIEWAAVEGQKEGIPVKPDPSIVFEILGKAPTPKSEVLYVGDSGVDMETARRACVDSVGVTWGFRPMSELKAYHADNIVNTADAILDLVLTDKY